MKKIVCLLMLLFCMHYYGDAQVGIGTTTPDDGSALQIDSTTGAFVPPRMTNTQMMSITTPLDGALVFNTTKSSYCIYKNSAWTSLTNSALVMNMVGTSGNSIISTNTNTYYDFPIGSSNVLVTNSQVYNVTANGTITIQEPGNYMFSASLSIRNMPSGSTKFIIAITVNGHLIGYLSRGFATLTGTDYWGTSGNIMYPINANDEVKIRYVINNGGTPLEAQFVNIGITKLN
ncbi:hypothetical protein [Flavivirga algicola]|uniref:C1q domain-containing protein n=1 Tax=Flavivirga algicola TaxID=2729136 RepID=A0ABX1RW95_9FLAO|nr:hypothetical protein [Flavivirga algicola]NMH87842.1 hypothetical protein [Flavivirga algicola]